MDRRGDKVGEGVEKDGECEHPRDGGNSSAGHCALASVGAWRGRV
jgi:hypothetical protein